MIFPKDISKRVNSAGNVSSSDKRNFIAFLVIVSNVVMYFLLSKFLKNYLGMDSKWAFRLQLIIFITVDILLFRFFIFNEVEHEEEFVASNKASFARYYKVRKELSSEIKSNIPLYEYNDGNVFAVIAVRYGANNHKRSMFTYRLFKDFIGEIYSNNYKINTISMSEEFEDTKEYESYIRTINSIEDKKLREQSLLMAEEVLKYVRDNSNVLMTYFIISTSTPSQKYYFGDNIESLANKLKNTESCIRDVELLNNTKYENLVRVNSNLEIIDMSMIKSIPSSDKDLIEFKSLVKVFDIEYYNNLSNKFVDKSVIDNKIRNNSKKVGD